MIEPLWDGKPVTLSTKKLVDLYNSRFHWTAIKHKLGDSVNLQPPARFVPWGAPDPKEHWLENDFPRTNL